MSAPGVSRGVRASDDERERVAKVLERAAAEGRLTPEEAGERLAAASAATYWDDLNQLVADLPMVHDRGRAQRWAVRRALRVAVIAVLVTSLWTFWGPRALWWPLGFMALAFVLRFRGRAWARAGGPGSRS